MKLRQDGVSHYVVIAILLILVISAFCYLPTMIQQPVYALYTWNGPKHYKENCSLPCDYTVTVNNYNFTIIYQITYGNSDLPPNYFRMNVTSMTIDAAHKTLTVNTINSLNETGNQSGNWVDLFLVVPTDLLDAPGDPGKFIVYADGKRITNRGCDTGDKKPAVCVNDNTATPESHVDFDPSTTQFIITVNEPGEHSISIIGTHVAPELPFSNVILLVTLVGFVGIIVVITRARFVTSIGWASK